MAKWIVGVYPEIRDFRMEWSAIPAFSGIRDRYAGWCGRRGVVRLLPIPIRLQEGLDNERKYKNISER